MPHPTITPPRLPPSDTKTASPARRRHGGRLRPAALLWVLALAALAMPLRADAVVCTGDYDYQAAVDAGCTEITGDLTIESTTLTSLAELSSLSSVGGGLYIRDNASLTSLEGLDSLESVGGDLEIYGNESLTSLEGLDSLESMGGELKIRDNASLTSLKGLESLLSVGGSLKIYENASLTSLERLESLSSIGGALKISSNPSLTNLAGLDSLESMGENLAIFDNASLTSLAGLDSLLSVGSLNIYYNPSLTNLAGLDSLESVGWYLEISYNASLTSLEGLDSLESVGGVLDIQHNASLCQVRVDSLVTGITISGTATTTPGNDGSCAGFCTGDYDYQAAVDAGCTEITGDLTIESTTLTSLAELSSLSSVGGYLYIYSNDSLTSLAGLDSLLSVGSLNIYSNDSLTNLAGLDSLSSAGWYLEISYNDSLTSLEGLDSLSSVGGNLYIQHNTSLCQDRVDSLVEGIPISGTATTAAGNDGSCAAPTESLEVIRATAWRNPSTPGWAGWSRRVSYEGVIAGLDFSSGLTFTVTDGASLDQSGSVATGACVTARNGKVHCAYRDPWVKKKVVRALFRPTGNGGEYRYKIWMNKLDIPASQAGPLGLTIDDGTTSYEGSAGNCTERRKKLVCRD